MLCYLLRHKWKINTVNCHFPLGNRNSITFQTSLHVNRINLFHKWAGNHFWFQLPKGKKSILITIVHFSPYECFGAKYIIWPNKYHCRAPTVRKKRQGKELNYEIVLLIHSASWTEDSHCLTELRNISFPAWFYQQIRNAQKHQHLEFIRI